MIIITIIAFILIFSILVMVHEWGHFMAARKAGIQVEEFGFGLPPKLFKIKKDKHGTVYTLNWIPFGGFVRLFGEDSMDPAVVRDKRSFASKSLWKRTTVVLAGVMMNFILAWLLIAIGFTVGMKPFLATPEDLQAGIASGIVETQKVFLVHGIDQAFPLARTEMKAGDLVTSINGIQVSESIDLSKVILPNTLNTVAFLQKGHEKAVMASSNAEGKLGMTISLEDNIMKVNLVRYPFWQAPVRATEEVVRLSGLTVRMLGKVVTTLFTKLMVPEGVAGPVGIARMTYTFAQQGFMALLQFMAMLSLSLAVINIMPFPALDGGRLLFIVFELVSRRRPNAKWETVIHTAGYAILMLMILAITWNDIMGLIK
jgi:regulator of sigma E protease